MAAVRDQAASASNTSPASGAPSPVGLDETSFLAAIAVHPSMLATRDLRVIDQLSAVLNRAWRTIFSGRLSTAWDNALVRQSGLRLPPMAGTATPYAYQAWRQVLIKETNWV
jgi:hypothetical protein